MSIQEQDGWGTTATDWCGMTDECVMILQPGGSTVDGEADFASFITNGVRINWGNAPAAAFSRFMAQATVGLNTTLAMEM